VDVQLAPASTLRVEFNDGSSATYATAPVDIYLAERFLDKTYSELVQTFGGWCYLAYSVALRRGDAYRAKKPGTSKTELFESWLATVADVVLETDQENTDDDNGRATNGNDPGPKEPATLVDSPP
jgi:hypothetical protein